MVQSASAVCALWSNSWAGCSLSRAPPRCAHKAKAPASQACEPDQSGLNLPAGFCASIFADDIGHARHIAIAADGVVYVNTWSGRYYAGKAPHAGGFLYAESNDQIVRYALTPGSIVPRGVPEIVVSGLPLTGDHPMRPPQHGASDTRRHLAL